MAKAYLMDVRTKLFIATDSSPAENTQLSIYEICSGMIEMVDGISNVYEGARYENFQIRDFKNLRLTELGDSDEDIMPAFDENHESWVTMKEEIVLCLYGITNNLALVCVVREDALNQRGKIKQALTLPLTVFSSGIMMYNLNLFRQTIRKTLEQSRT